MIISTATPLPNATTPAPSPVTLESHAGQLDFSHMLKELDLDGDGQISDQEFGSYRAAKAARGEFVPADGPGNQGTGNKAASELAEILFHKAMENGSTDS
ncbi:EF-hand domain-containing protein [Parasedimentitalea psychrophila]|uniref:EF-hand domain-containing protein n=1 Tax=Parasedimentitalea psychrophila TaxID=2997337 RepID=A0A9Y2P7M1_9RHOB|nr:hypothetical protein [Parasedimentitalea psychrophila]WIY25965.1 hypothetical protein QPJ95_03235 [Parasedimentitalea psychrophila]